MRQNQAFWRALHSLAHPLSMPFRGWVLLSVAALATMANTTPYRDYGIVCLTEQDSTLYAIAPVFLANESWDKVDTLSVYTANETPLRSTDGGFNWSRDKSFSWKQECSPHRETWTMSDPVDENIRYRFTPSVKIERSTDGGQTWQREVAFSWYEARLVYYERQKFTDIHPGPLNALIHSSTGNAIVAMGREGILLRTPDGEWNWVSIDSEGYHRIKEMQTGDVQYFLEREQWLALLLMALIISTLAEWGHHSILETIVLVVVWSIWGIIVVILRPAISYDNTSVMNTPAMRSILGLCLSTLLTVPLAAIQAGRLGSRSPLALILAGVAAIVAALLFLAPYLLWSQGSIPHYNFAILVALSLVAGTLLIAGWLLKRYFMLSAVEKDEPQITQA